MTKKSSKLNLNKETVRTLTSAALGQVNGGGVIGRIATSVCNVNQTLQEDYNTISLTLSQSQPG